MNAETVVAVVAAVIALFATAVSAWQVHLMREQTKIQQRVAEESVQPYVWVDIQPSDTQGVSMHFVIGNSGPTVATDVRVSLSSPIEGRSPLWGQVQDRLKHGFSSLAPGRTVRWPISRAADLVESEESQPRTIRIEYIGPYGPVGPIEYVIDLADYRESLDDPFGSLHMVRKEIEELTTVLKNQPIKVTPAETD